VSVAAVAVVPAAPLVLPAASPDQPAVLREPVAALRAAAADALGHLGARTVVLLATGDEPLLHDAAMATLASYGLPHVTAELDIAEELLTSIAARGQAPRVRSERLDGDLAVLALQLLAVVPDARVVPMSVPGVANADALSAMATGLEAAITDHGEPVAVVAAGDLAATLDTTSPGYLVEGATRWDEEATAAIAASDPTALAALGPEGAQRFQARGWAPLTVLVAVASSADRPLTHTDYHAPKGVGQLVAR
jgi:AmmeMemoRadiSam system protein B